MKPDLKIEYTNYIAFFQNPNEFEQWQLGHNSGVRENVHPRMPEGAEILSVDGGVVPNTTVVWQSSMYVIVNYIIRK